MNKWKLFATEQLAKQKHYTVEMQVTDIIASIDQEIARLKQVRAILSDGTSTRAGNANASKKRARKRRTLSPEARKRIADAQKKRWAAQRSKDK